MKVLMLGWELPPHHSGGLPVVCYQMCKSLCKQGLAVEFVVPYQADHGINFMPIHSATNLTSEEFKSGYDGYGFNFESKISSIRSQSDYSGLIGRTHMYADGIEPVVKTTEFDVIHAHDWLTVSAALRAKQLSGAPLVLHIHATEFDHAGGHRGNELIHEIEEIGLSMADRIIAVSQKIKNQIVDYYGISPDKVEVVHNRLDPSTYHHLGSTDTYQAIAKLKASGYKMISHVGRVTIMKGLWNLLHSFKLVVDQEPRSILLIAGSGEQIRELQILAADLGIAQNVLFTNTFINGQNWRDAFLQSDLFVMASVSEPFGLTPLEAALFDTPSVVTKQSGVAEVFNNCLKVDNWDIYGMANKITSALRSQSLRQTLSYNSRLEVERMTWDNAGGELNHVYQGVVA